MKVLVFFCLLAVAASEFQVVQIDPCEPPNPDGTPAATACDIHEVRIDPCKKPPCSLTKGEKASISFDFTPKFSASSLKTMAYWATGDVPFDGLGGDNGCDYTTCPVEPGKKQVFNYDLTLGKKLPTGTFTFKWKVWNTENVSQDFCCFKTAIKLKKAKK